MFDFLKRKHSVHELPYTRANIPMPSDTKSHVQRPINMPPLILEESRIIPIPNITITCNINDDPEKIKEFVLEVRKAIRDAYNE